MIKLVNPKNKGEKPIMSKLYRINVINFDFSYSGLKKLIKYSKTESCEGDNIFDVVTLSSKQQADFDNRGMFVEVIDDTLPKNTVIYLIQRQWQKEPLEYDEVTGRPLPLPTIRIQDVQGIMRGGDKISCTLKFDPNAIYSYGKYADNSVFK